MKFVDVRLKKFAEEKQELQNEVQKLQQQFNDIKSRGGRRSSSINGVVDDDDYEDAQRKNIYERLLKIMDPN